MEKKRLLSILEEVDAHEKVRVSSLAEKLQVSEMTIRKDLKFLDREKLLKRTYGGAQKCGEHFYKRSIKNDVFVKVAAKIALSKAAYKEIHDGDTVMLDGSSTCVHLAGMIKNNSRKRLVLITNSLLVANEVMDVCHVELIFLGGTVQKNLASTKGTAALEELGKQRGDICFLSPNGISLEKGITIVDYEQMRIKKAMLKYSEKACVLADSSKLGKCYASKVCDWGELWKILISCDCSREDKNKLGNTLPRNTEII